jgi:hypothetical protein
MQWAGSGQNDIHAVPDNPDKIRDTRLLGTSQKVCKMQGKRAYLR